MKKVIDETFFYTKEEMVKDLLQITPIDYEDSVLDAGSGRNKVWFKNLKCKIKYECEIEDGQDFFKWDKKVDWVIGNPPHRNSSGGDNLIWKWIEKASEIARKGMAFLFNHRFWLVITPKRLKYLQYKGFYIQKVHVVCDKRWFGRYFYVIFTKQKTDFITFSEKNY